MIFILQQNMTFNCFHVCFFLFLAFPEGSAEISVLSGILIIRSGQTDAGNILRCFIASDF